MTQYDKSANPHNEAIPEIGIEFSRPIDLTSFGAKGRHYKYQATKEERTALAKRYLVLSVDDLEAKCKITPARKGSFKLEVTFKATIMQSCGITLDSVEDNISSSFALTLQQSTRQTRTENPEIEFSPDEEDVEFINSNLIDMGEMIAQHLSLEINPYPRKKGTTGEELGQKIIKEEDADLEPEKKNPFAILKSLKHKT